MPVIAHAFLAALQFTYTISLLPTTVRPHHWRAVSAIIRITSSTSRRSWFYPHFYDTTFMQTTCPGISSHIYGTCLIAFTLLLCGSDATFLQHDGITTHSVRFKPAKRSSPILLSVPVSQHPATSHSLYSFWCKTQTPSCEHFHPTPTPSLGTLPVAEERSPLSTLVPLPPNSSRGVDGAPCKVFSCISSNSPFSMSPLPPPSLSSQPNGVKSACPSATSGRSFCSMMKLHQTHPNCFYSNHCQTSSAPLVRRSTTSVYALSPTVS